MPGLVIDLDLHGHRGIGQDLSVSTCAGTGRWRSAGTVPAHGASQDGRLCVIAGEAPFEGRRIGRGHVNNPPQGIWEAAQCRYADGGSITRGAAGACRHRNDDASTRLG